MGMRWRRCKVNLQEVAEASGRKPRVTWMRVEAAGRDEDLRDWGDEGDGREERVLFWKKYLKCVPVRCL